MNKTYLFKDWRSKKLSIIYIDSERSEVGIKENECLERLSSNSDLFFVFNQEPKIDARAMCNLYGASGYCVATEPNMIKTLFNLFDYMKEFIQDKRLSSMVFYLMNLSDLSSVSSEILMKLPEVSDQYFGRFSMEFTEYAIRKQALEGNLSFKARWIDKLYNLLPTISKDLSKSISRRGSYGSHITKDIIIALSNPYHFIDEIRGRTDYSEWISSWINIDWKVGVASLVGRSLASSMIDPNPIYRDLFEEALNQFDSEVDLGFEESGLR